MRTELTGPSVYHFDPINGSDATGDGSPAAPWQTLAHATTWTKDNLDLRGFELKLKMAPGQLDSTWITGPWVGQTDPSQVVIEGDISTPSKCKLIGSVMSAIDAAYYAQFRLRGLYMASPGRSCIYAHEGAWVSYDHMEFGPCPNGPQIEASKHGSTFDYGDVKIVGSANAHLYASDTGQCYTTTGDTELIGTPHFAAAFAWANYGGKVTSHTKNFIGSATGKRFLAIMGGTVGSATLTTYPGDQMGETDADSQFVTGDGTSRGAYPDGRAAAGPASHFGCTPFAAVGNFNAIQAEGYWRRLMKDPNVAIFNIAITVPQYGMGSAVLWANVPLPFVAATSGVILLSAGLQHPLYQGVLTAGSNIMSVQKADGTFGFYDGLVLIGNGSLEIQ